MSHTFMKPTNIILNHIAKYKKNFGITDAETVAILDVLPDHCFDFYEFMQHALEICDVHIKVDPTSKKIKFILGQSLDIAEDQTKFKIEEIKSYTSTIFNLTCDAPMSISCVALIAYINKLVDSKTQSNIRYAICNDTISVIASAPPKKAYYVVDRHRPKTVQGANKTTKHKTRSRAMPKKSWFHSLFGTN